MQAGIASPRRRAGAQFPGAFPDIPLHTRDYEDAHFFNQCRSRGVAGSPIDLLLCAVAHRRNLSIFTPDADFERYARHVPVRLHHAPRAR